MSAHVSARSTLFAALLAVALIGPASTRAAEVTHVASSFETDTPFDAEPSVGFERTQRRGTITRERHQEDHIADVLELRYTEISTSMPLRAAVGLYQDLELHFGASIVFGDNRSWGYPALDKNGQPVTNDSNSTIRNNCINNRGGLTASTCQGDSFLGAQPIFSIPGSAYRAGWTNPYVGLSWAILSDRKDDTKPTWTISADYVVPNWWDTFNPSIATTPTSPGGLAQNVHHFNFATAVSKKLGPADPYVKITYSLPNVAHAAYSNCNNPALLGYAENCNAAGTPWTSQETGIKPPHVAQFIFGSEFYFFDDPVKKQRIGIDIQFLGQYNSEGRYYNELSDAVGKMLYTEDYLTLGGQIGLYARPVEYVQFRLNASLYTDTEHWLTNEPVGRDLDNTCNGVSGQKCVDLTNNTKEINPTFDFRYDMPGRRFRISEVNVFSLMATGRLMF